MDQPIIKKKKAPVKYVDNQELLLAFKAYKKRYHASNGTCGIDNYIGKAIQDIAKNLSTMPKFNGYSYLDEMISDGIENCLMYIHNFDPEKYDNPFAYITKIVYYAFLRRIAKEKKQQYIKYKMTASYGIYNDVVSGDAGKTVEVFDNLNEFIEIFETKKKEKDAKKAKKPSKKGLENYVE